PNTGAIPVPETTTIAKGCCRWIRAGGLNRSHWLPRSAWQPLPVPLCSHALRGSPCWYRCVPTRSMGTRKNPLSRAFYGTASLFAGSGVSVGVQQVVQVGSIDRFNFEKPAFAVRVFIHQFRRVRQRFVNSSNTASHRGVDVGGTFYRFNHGHILFCAHIGTVFRQFNKHHITQLLLGKVGDANGKSAIG